MILAYTFRDYGPKSVENIALGALIDMQMARLGFVGEQNIKRDRKERERGREAVGASGFVGGILSQGKLKSRCGLLNPGE